MMKMTIDIEYDGNDYYIELNGQKIYFPTYTEAEEYVRENYNHESSINRIDFFEQFKLYCKKLPGKIFIDGAIATYNEKALIRFITNFEKTHDCKIEYKKTIIDGEMYCLITQENIY